MLNSVINQLESQDYYHPEGVLDAAHSSVYFYVAGEEVTNLIEDVPQITSLETIASALRASVGG